MASSSTSATAVPTLLIVMGTSGSGKSTVGAALSSALSCPFVDGDDLHPSSNVEKMSQGHPLNDDDREPWLKKIRRFGLDLARTQKIPSDLNNGHQATGDKSEPNKLAEVYETSHQPLSDVDHHAAAAAQQEAQNNTASSEPHGSKRHLAIIACSSLKLVYRRLLRGTISSLADPAATLPESQAPIPQDLKVVHIYLDLSKQLLEQRMTNRKGHFMKLDMLYSQLATLQVPDEHTEVGIVSVKIESGMATDEIVARIVDKLKARDMVQSL